MKGRLLEAVRVAGAVAVGIARASAEGEDDNRRLLEWVSRGMNAGMTWMERHALLRQDLNNVLPGVRSVICAAFPYAPAVEREGAMPYISRYAYGPDYHEAIRARLNDILVKIELDNVCRICIDSAPVSERFLAVQAGIGYLGDNGALIVPGIGPEVFLAEILTTLELEPDKPNSSQCLHCGACRRACPTGALQSDGTIDCRRCISYLTIEHRGQWTEPVAVEAMSTSAGRNSLFGCDRCITACPLGRSLKAIEPLPQILSFAPDAIPQTPAEFKKMFAHTALMRTGPDGLRRNVANIKKNS